MYKTIIVLPDATELASGIVGQDAVRSVTTTACVNEGLELTPGSCCTTMLEAKISTPGGGLSISAGDELTLYRQDEDGTRHMAGIFIAEKPTRSGANIMTLTAYDRIIKLDKDLTAWLSGLTAWPIPLYDLAFNVCVQCGLELANESVPNGDYQVQKFSADGITGRQLLRWVGQISGQFCRATTDGKVEFAWYTRLTGGSINPTARITDFSDGNLQITAASVAASFSGDTLSLTGLNAREGADGELVLTISEDSPSCFYFLGSLTYEDYDVAPIEKVQLRQNEEDVGTVYPDTAEALNTYAVTGNYLLTNLSADSLAGVAQTLCEQVKGLTYRPCRVSIPANPYILPGHILTVTDRNGKTFSALVMSKTSNGQKDTLECTGSATRESSTAVNNQTFKALAGKVLNLRADVDGIRVENKDTHDNLASLELTVENIGSTVQRQEETAENLKTQLTQVEQTASSLSIRISTIESDGVSRVETGLGYTFDDDGLHIRNEGQQMENLLDHTGMEVTRNGETMLRADKDGVLATDVTVRNYLIVGNSRFESYGSGTGCFYFGG